MPAPNGSHDFVWIGRPGEALELVVVLVEEAVDRGLSSRRQTEKREHEPGLCEGRKKALDRADVGAKRNVYRE
jgi:hypothetical protein